MKNKFKSITFFLFFLFIIPFSFGTYSDDDFTELFPTTEYDYYTDNLAEAHPYHGNLSGFSKISLDNDYWWISNQLTLDGWLTNTSVNTQYNTKYAGVFRVANASATVVNSHLLYEFAQDVKIWNRTLFNFYCANQQEAGSNMWLVWGKANGSYYGWGLDDLNVGGDSTCNANGWNGNVDCCDINDLSWFDDLCQDAGQTRVRINFSGENISKGCGKWDNFNDGSIKLFGIQSADNSNGRAGVIDDILIRDYGTGTNELPSFNFSVDKNIKCINESQSSVTFDLNITAEDPESDTIYYSSMDTFNSKNVNDSIYYTKSTCVFGLCDYERDYESITNYVRLDDTVCPIDLTLPIENYSFALSRQDYYFNGYGLYMNSNCEYDDDSTYYFTTNNMNRVWYNSKIWDTNDNDDNFTFTMYDEIVLNEILKLRFENNATHTKVWNYNTTWTEIITFPVQESIDFTIYNLITNESQVNLLIDGLSIYTLNLNVLNYDISVFKYEIDDGDIIQEYFHYSAVGDEYSFSTTKPDTFTANNYGTFPLKLAVSDSVHQPYPYEEEEIIVKVVPCEFYADLPDPNDVTDPNDLVTDFNILGLVKYFFGDRARLFLVAMDLYEDANTIMYWFWLALFLGGMFTYFITFQQINIIMPLLSSSTICGFLSFVLGLTGPLIVFLIAISFTLMGPIVVAWLGGLNQQDGR